MTYRLLIATPEYRGYGGGIMTFYRRLAPVAAAQGFSVHVIEGSAFSSFATAAPESVDGVFVEGLERSRVVRWSARFGHLSAAPTLRRILAAAWASREQAAEKGPFDIVEATEFGLLHVPYVSHASAPLAVQCHAGWGQIGLYDPTPGLELDHTLALALETEALRHASARHTYAEANADWWEGQGTGAFTRIRPCWSPASDVRAGTEADSVIRVFGRIQAWKGPAVAAAAWNSAPELPDVEWYGRDVFTNARGDSTDAALRISYPGVWGMRIRPRRTVPPAEVARLQSRALLNLVPSTWDVFNFTAAEAMASGRPVVCSDKAGASELIEDGRTGFVYDGASPTALREAVRRALSLGSEHLARIGADGRAAVLEALNPERQARAHLAAYGATIQAPRSDPEAIPAWFRDLVMPRDPLARNGYHLDQHPLRELVAHVLDRTLRKVRLKA